MLLFSATYLFSQTPNIIWAKSLGGSQSDQAHSVTGTGDGGYAIVGQTTSNDNDVSGNHGSYDVWLVKTDSAANIQWQKCLGGSGTDVGVDIVQTRDGGYYVAAYSGSVDGDVGSNKGGMDYWVIRLDSVGNILWSRDLGGSLDDYPISLVETLDSGCIVVGYATSSDGDVTDHIDMTDYWVIRFDKAGTVLWKKSYGSLGNEDAHDIIRTFDGNYAILGRTDIGSHGGFDYWLIKIDDQGTLLWQRDYGGTGSDGGIALVQTADSGFVMIGTSDSNDGQVSGNHGYQDYWVVKVDKNGNIQWQKSLGGSGYDWAQCVISVADNGYLAGGYSSSSDGQVTVNNGDYDYWFVRLDSSGNMLCQKSLGGSLREWLYSFVQARDNTFLLAGRSSSNDGDVSGNHGSDDFWLVKVADPLQLTITKSDVTCEGNDDGTASVKVSGGARPYSIVWSTNDTGSVITGLAAGKYSVTVTDAYNYQATDSVDIQNTVSYPADYSLTVDHTELTCMVCNAQAQANVSGGAAPYSYLWSTGATGETITGLCAGTYTVIVSDANNCKISGSVTVSAYQTQVPLCMVTVDTATGNHVIIWERPASVYDSFFVYRSTDSVNYEKIASTDGAGMTVFVDTNIYNTSVYYKIRPLSFCGDTLDFSLYHRSIYLQAQIDSPAGVVRLYWTGYKDGSGSFVPAQYYVYRSASPQSGDFVVIDTVSSTAGDYTDMAPLQGSNYYILMAGHSPCVASDSVGNTQVYSNLFSNTVMVNYSGISTDVRILDRALRIYPNPVSSWLNVEFNYPGPETYQLRLLDAMGRTVYQARTHSAMVRIPATNLRPGVYLLVISVDSNVLSRKVLVQ